MREKLLLSALFVITFLKASFAGAITTEDFQVRTSENWLDLCTVSASDPLAQQAIHFCYGYLGGAFHYHVAENAAPSGPSV